MMRTGFTAPSWRRRRRWREPRPSKPVSSVQRLFPASVPGPAVSPAGAFPGWPDSSARQAGPARHSEPEELKALEQASSSALVIDSFVPETAIDAVYFEDTYYLGAGKNGERGYRVLSQARRRDLRRRIWSRRSKRASDGRNWPRSPPGSLGETVGPAQARLVVGGSPASNRTTTFWKPTTPDLRARPDGPARSGGSPRSQRP